MLDNIFKIIDKNFDSEIKFLQKLISFNTVYDYQLSTKDYPVGKNISDSLDYILENSIHSGFKSKNIDNLVGYAEIGKGDNLIGILCHLDTVPYNDLTKWISPPTAASIIDDAIIGRGAIDNKGPTVACYYALLALIESGIEFKSRFRMILGLDEETEFRCVDRYLETEEIPKSSFVPDAKFPAVYGEKGILRCAIKRSFEAIPSEPIILLGISAGEKSNIVPDKATAYFGGKDIAKIYIQLEDLALENISYDYFENMLKVDAVGKSVHAMHPEKGDNAILRLLDALARLDFAPSELNLWIKQIQNLFKFETDGKSLGIAMQDDISTPLSINFAILRYDSKDLQANFDIRYPVTIDDKYFETFFTEAMKKTSALLQIQYHKKPLYVDKNSKFVEILLDSYRSMTSDMSEPITIGGGTYARAFPNSISFGADMPDEEELAHQCNEKISLDKLKLITKIYAKAIYNLNNL